MFKIVNGLTPPYLCEMLTHSASFHDYGLRSSKMKLALPKSHTDFYKIVLHLPEQKWKDFPTSFEEESSLKRFMGKLDLYYQHQQKQVPEH